MLYTYWLSERTEQDNIWLWVMTRGPSTTRYVRHDWEPRAIRPDLTKSTRISSYERRPHSSKKQTSPLKNCKVSKGIEKWVKSISSSPISERSTSAIRLCAVPWYNRPTPNTAATCAEWCRSSSAEVGGRRASIWMLSILVMVTSIVPRLQARYNIH